MTASAIPEPTHDAATGEHVPGDGTPTGELLDPVEATAPDAPPAPGDVEGEEPGTGDGDDRREGVLPVAAPPGNGSLPAIPVVPPPTR